MTKQEYMIERMMRMGSFKIDGIGNYTAASNDVTYAYPVPTNATEACLMERYRAMILGSWQPHYSTESITGSTWDMRGENNMRYQIYEGLDKYKVIILLPGFKKEDVEVRIIDMERINITLTKNKNFTGDDPDMLMCDIGSDYDQKSKLAIQRSADIYLKDLTDDVSTSFEDGLLVLEIKKDIDIKLIEMK